MKIASLIFLTTVQSFVMIGNKYCLDALEDPNCSKVKANNQVKVINHVKRF